ncbi:MAG: hypothetical protein IJ677_02810 [Alphaproteobacteria bacterium]|nr:hypothetical protein [Alphaproteobacteria bacterium]
MFSPTQVGRPFGSRATNKKTTVTVASFIGADRETRTPDPLITNQAKSLIL